MDYVEVLQAGMEQEFCYQKPAEEGKSEAARKKKTPCCSGGSYPVWVSEAKSVPQI